MHPNASFELCAGKVIDSHTIQRKGPLKRIVDGKNCVCHFEPSRESPDPIVTEIGWRNASTFPGYCAKHDSDLFSVLEQRPFCGTNEQCVLQSFRSLCNELYRKRALIESLTFQRDRIDRGCDIDRQINLQLSITHNIEGQQKSVEENLNLWRSYETAIRNGEFDQFSSKCYFFNGDLCLTSSAAVQAEFDFNGERLVDMWDLSVDAQILSHSILTSEGQGCIVFTWRSEDKSAERMVSTFDHILDRDRADIFVQYCFLTAENTYFSRTWWDGLSRPQHRHLKRLAAALYYEGGEFVPTEPPLVNWKFQAI
jgi:hypothetical protein